MEDEKKSPEGEDAAAKPTLPPTEWLETANPVERRLVGWFVSHFSLDLLDAFQAKLAEAGLEPDEEFQEAADQLWERLGPLYAGPLHVGPATADEE